MASPQLAQHLLSIAWWLLLQFISNCLITAHRFHCHLQRCGCWQTVNNFPPQFFCDATKERRNFRHFPIGLRMNAICDIGEAETTTQNERQLCCVVLHLFCIQFSIVFFERFPFASLYLRRIGAPPLKFCNFRLMKLKNKTPACANVPHRYSSAAAGLQITNENFCLMKIAGDAEQRNTRPKLRCNTLCRFCSKGT